MSQMTDRRNTVAKARLLVWSAKTTASKSYIVKQKKTFITKSCMQVAEG